MAAKYIFVTGGVVSGLGKGITAASLGRLLKDRGLKVTVMKLDPYLNVDPGTMNPIQHGEVFVTDDGAETDLDLGHYERFIDESLTKNSSCTSGSVYFNVLSNERKGVYGGQTVQIIPHITNEIKRRIALNETENTDIPPTVIKPASTIESAFFVVSFVCAVLPALSSLPVSFCRILGTSYGTVPAVSGQISLIHKIASSGQKVTNWYGFPGIL